MQGLMVVGFIVDEILRVGFKNDSHKSTKYRSSRDIEEKSYARFDGCRLYS